MPGLSASRKDIFVARIVSEDAHFAMLEVGKSDEVSWQVGGVPGAEGDEPPRFLTLLFIRQVGDRTAPFDPFKGG